MTRPFDPDGFGARIGPAPFLALATLSQTGMSFVQQGIVVMGVFFASLFRLSLAQMGLLTTALSLGIMASMVVMGAVADRVGPRRLLFFGSVAMGSLSLLFLWVSGFDALLVLLFALGLALAITPASGTKAVFTAFRGRPRGMVMGIRQTGVPLGALLAASILPRVAGGPHGVRPMFWLFAAELLLFGWLFSGSMERAPKTHTSRTRARLSRGILVQIWRPALIAMLMVSGQYLVLGFSLSDLHRVHHVGLAAAGLILASSQLGGGAGRIVTGVISDRMGGRRTPVLMMCGITAAVMSWVVAFLPQHLGLGTLAVIWFVFGVGATGWNALTIAWAGDSVPAEHSGFAMSSVGTAAFLGSAIFPPLFGALVDATHLFSLGWTLLGGVLGLAAFLSWRFGQTTEVRRAS